MALNEGGIWQGNSAECEWFASCPKGLEQLLAQELSGLGAIETRSTIAGCYFVGPLALAYRACLWSRLANRILLPVARLEVESADQLYSGLRGVNWAGLFSTEQTFAIDFSGENHSIRNTQFGAQRSKDAIVDWFADSQGARPNVDRKEPNIRLNLHLSGPRLAVAMDMSGGSLHRRGYRTRAGTAPLKENLAAALLIRAGWPEIASRGGALIDPMCGAATLLLEGAMMAADIAPGLNRQRFGFDGWQGHQPDQWRVILADARSRAAQGVASDVPEIRGYDEDPHAIKRAQQNIAEAGLQKLVRVSSKPLSKLQKPSHKPMPDGLVICNPPYGERLGDAASLHYLYAQLGKVLSREFGDWQAAIVTSDLSLGKAVGLRSHKRYKLFNGSLPVTLLLFELSGNNYREPGEKSAPGAATTADFGQDDASSSMFANRLRKNQRRLSRWLTREGISCYRLYDADMPEYAVAVDVYDKHLHVAEYSPPAGIDPAAAERRLQTVMASLAGATGLAGKIALKQRRRQRGSEQYQKEAQRGELIGVTEGRAKLLVNLFDYLDTGLFLDHRPLRRQIAAQAPGKRFLNLFCYTGAATIHAALAGARFTTSVDLSNTYLDWLRKNLAHNGLGEAKNDLVRADCRSWLAEDSREYDLILLDPPSFSNSARMDGTLDIQRDHQQLVTAAMDHLATDGTLYFSNNRRGFKLDEALEGRYACRDISAQTLDPDFQRNPKIHRCWEFRHFAARTKGSHD